MVFPEFLLKMFVSRHASPLLPRSRDKQPKLTYDERKARVEAKKAELRAAKAAEEED